MDDASQERVASAVLVVDLDEGFYAVFDVDGRRVGVEQWTRSPVGALIGGVGAVASLVVDDELAARLVKVSMRPQNALWVLGIDCAVAEAGPQWQGAATVADGLARVGTDPEWRISEPVPFRP